MDFYRKLWFDPTLLPGGWFQDVIESGGWRRMIKVGQVSTIPYFPHRENWVWWFTGGKFPQSW